MVFKSLLVFSKSKTTFLTFLINLCHKPVGRSKQIYNGYVQNNKGTINMIVVRIKQIQCERHTHDRTTGGESTP